MDSARSDCPTLAASPGEPPVVAKILVAGGFGVGKTTLASAISEIRPLRTEELLTDMGIGVDDVRDVAQKATTTVAMGLGRITFPRAALLYLFGPPAPARSWCRWEAL